MERKNTTPSVIAKLMGLDELQPQHVSHGPIKVLSEDYLRKTASLAILEKSSIHVNCSSGIVAGKEHGTKHVFGVKPVQSSTERSEFSFARQRNSHAMNSHTIDEKNCHADEPNNILKDLHLSRNSGKMSAKRNAWRSSQNNGNGSGEFGVENLDELSKTHLELKGVSCNISSRIVVLKPNPGDAQNCARGLFFVGRDTIGQDSDKDGREHGYCLKSENKIIENENGRRGMDPGRHILRDTRLVDDKAVPEESVDVRISHRLPSRSRSIVKDPSLCLHEALMTPYQGSFHLRKREKISNQFLNGSSFSKEAKTNIFERWKTTKNFEEGVVSGGRCTLGQMFALHDGDAKLKSLHTVHKKGHSSESVYCQKDNSECSTSMVHSSKVNSTNKYIRNLPSRTLLKNSFVVDGTSDPKTRIEASQERSLVKKQTGTDYNLSSSKIILSGSQDILLLKHNQGVQDELKKNLREEADGYSSSNARDDLTQQKTSYDSPKEELMIFTSRASDSGSVKNLREMNQPSPDSVLEPACKEENDHVSGSLSPVLDLNGLAMKLHLLNNESEEITSEESTMAVSSDDEDTEKGSVSQNCEKLWGPLRPEESRDFSYIIDVLDEATLFGLNLDTWCESWHETEYPLSPSVFEALEKKYGKQTSWLKSERRLLFDYINSGLRAILDSYMDFGVSAKPLRRRLNTTPKKSDIEEELWMQLSQEKEAKKDSCEKAFGSEVKWLELEDDISIICKEIVEFLFDELATEICN